MGNGNESLSTIVICSPYVINLVTDLVLLSGGANANVSTSIVEVVIVMGGWKPNLTISGTVLLVKVGEARI